MPTEQASIKGASDLGGSQTDITVEIHSEESRLPNIRQGSFPESVAAGPSQSTEKLATYEEVDETEEKQVSEDRGVQPQQPLERAQQDQTDQTNDPLHHAETYSSGPFSGIAPDSKSAGGKNITELDHNVVDVNRASDQSEVNRVDDEDEHNQHSGEEDVEGEDEQNLDTEDSSAQKQANQPRPGATAASQTAGVSTTTQRSVFAKAQEKDTKTSDTGSTVRTPRATKGKSVRQGSARDTDQRGAKRVSSATSTKSPRTTESRISRATAERNQKRDAGKPDKSNDRILKNTTHRTPGKSSAVESSVPKTDDDKDTKLEEETDLKALTKAPSRHRTNSRESEDKPASTLELTKSNTQSKPANGLIRSDGKGKGVEVDENKDKKVEEDQLKKAHALLSRAVMRRAAKVDGRPPSQTPAPQPNAVTTDLNSSAGSKSLSGAQRKISNPALNSSAGSKSLPGVQGKTPNPALNSSAGSKSLSGTQGKPPNPAHKTQSMQSLAVPTLGIGPTLPETDDRVSLGSRRDSAKLSMDSGSRKSVDYRLQTSQAVVPAVAGEEKSKSLLLHDDSTIRGAIPALPVPLAVVCLLLNIVLPGSGTIVSGMSVLCCSKPRLPSSKGDAVAYSVCINLFVGAAQLGTVTFLLVGWFWSLAWGVKMVILAVEHRAEQRQQREKELQTLALRAFGSPGNLRRSIFPPPV